MRHFESFKEAHWELAASLPESFHSINIYISCFKEHSMKIIFHMFILKELIRSGIWDLLDTRTISIIDE